MFKKFTLSAVLALGMVSLASASGFGGAIGVGGVATGFQGTGGGYAESATVGGSMAQGAVNGTGVSAQFTSNEGNGYSSAGAHVNQSGVVTYTAGGSNAANVSGGFTAGNANGTTSGAVGTDFSSNAWGSFETGTIGGGIIIGGFAGFGSF